MDAYASVWPIEWIEKDRNLLSLSFHFPGHTHNINCVGPVKEKKEKHFVGRMLGHFNQKIKKNSRILAQHCHEVHFHSFIFLYIFFGRRLAWTRSVGPPKKMKRKKEWKWAQHIFFFSLLLAHNQRSGAHTNLWAKQREKKMNAAHLSSSLTLFSFFFIGHECNSSLRLMANKK